MIEGQKTIRKLRTPGRANRLRGWVNIGCGKGLKDVIFRLQNLHELQVPKNYFSYIAVILLSCGSRSHQVTLVPLLKILVISFPITSETWPSLAVMSDGSDCYFCKKLYWTLFIPFYNLRHLPYLLFVSMFLSYNFTCTMCYFRLSTETF